jgi:A/G-specific adenine glycosylase
LEQRIDKNMSVDDARKQGHAIFPLDPPKTKKREEDLAVLVLANHHGGDVWWLFIRRPPEGLLAGQWEFPSVCMETRQEGEDNSSNHDVTQRRKRLTHYLSSIVANGNQSWWSNKIKLKTVNDEPIDHVFSHIRHIMWLESAILDVDLKVTNWTTTDGREVRWMREKDWKKVGITSGVKKILKVVQSQHGDSASTTVSARKRKR